MRIYYEARIIKMIITKENLKKLLAKGASIHGAWNLAQLKAILPKEEFGKRKGAFPRKGWKCRLIGRELTQEQIDEFVRLKNKHLGHKSRTIPGQRTLDREINSHMRSIGQEIRDSQTNSDCNE